MIDTANESLLQQGELYYYSPYASSLEKNNEENDTIAERRFSNSEEGGFTVGGHSKRIKIIQAKAQERNVYLSQPSTRVSGSYVGMRAAGSRTQLIMFEYNSEASSKVTDISEESGILATIAKPIILLIFFGGTCWLSYSQVKKKRETNRATFAGGFGSGYADRSRGR